MCPGLQCVFLRISAPEPCRMGLEAGLLTWLPSPRFARGDTQRCSLRLPWPLFPGATGHSSPEDACGAWSPRSRADTQVWGLLRWGGHVCFPLHEAAHLFSERLHHGNGSLGSGSSGPKLLTCSPDTWELQHLGEGKVAMPAGTAARRRCWVRLAKAVPSLNTAPSCCLQEGDWAASLLLLSAEQ